MLMHIAQMEDRMEEVLNEVVTRHYPRHWKEDVITHEFLIRLEESFGREPTTLYGTRFPIDLTWQIYKFHGKRETNYGDVGLLLHYRMPAGGTIEAAGFLEAKIRDRDTTKFLQVRDKQTADILARSPETRLLLYDYNPIAVLNDSEIDSDLSFFPFVRRRQAAYAYFTHGAVLPLQLAAAVNQYDDTLYRFCHSFSHQFTRRYFQLHDLDFTKQAVDAVKGFPSIAFNSPNFIMVVRATPQGQELPDEFRPDETTYEAIRSDQ